MAVYKTYAQLKAKVDDDCDLQSETFISASEMLALFNEAITEAEKRVHKLNEDYFLASASLTLVNGQEAYDLPTNIYAQKIRAIIYRNGTEVFPIKRLRDWKKLEVYEWDKTNLNNRTLYNYFVDNSTAGSPKIIITPTPQESGTYVRIYYIRSANRFTTGTDILDLPESDNFVVDYVKDKVFSKEHNPIVTKVGADLQSKGENLLTGLAEKTPDNETLIEADLSAYYDMT